MVISSGRIASALVCLVALLWTNALTLFVAGVGRKALPEKGREGVLVFVASFACFLFYFVLSLASPFQAMENAFCILLCPVFLLASGLYSRVQEYDTPEMVFQAVSEALVLGMLILALALIREPLGSGSVSLPSLGLVRLIGGGLSQASDPAAVEPLPLESRFFLEPMALLKLSSGALIILGYGVALYRHRRNLYTNQEDE
jgi:hypothetical protein